MCGQVSHCPFNRPEFNRTEFGTLSRNKYKGHGFWHCCKFVAGCSKLRNKRGIEPRFKMWQPVSLSLSKEQRNVSIESYNVTARKKRNTLRYFLRSFHSTVEIFKSLILLSRRWCAALRIFCVIAWCERAKRRFARTIFTGFTAPFLNEYRFDPTSECEKLS